MIEFSELIQPRLNDVGNLIMTIFYQQTTRYFWKGGEDFAVVVKVHGKCITLKIGEVGKTEL